MGPQLGETLVPTARQSTCGTGTIQECPSLKLPLEAITPQAPATTIPTLTITPIMGHLHLYKITPNTPKTQAPQVGPWNLLCNTSPGHPTTGVPLWLKVGESYPAPTQNQRAHGGSLHPLRSAWTTVRLPGANLLGAVGAGETAIQTAMAGETQLCHLHLANLPQNLCKMDGEVEVKS